MDLIRPLLLFVILFASNHCEAQLDSTIESLQKIPGKYILKIDKYSSRITGKTKKVLARPGKIEDISNTINPGAVIYKSDAVIVKILQI